MDGAHRLRICLMVLSRMQARVNAETSQDHHLCVTFYYLIWCGIDSLRASWFSIHEGSHLKTSSEMKRLPRTRHDN
jgi:SET domain-containing protein